MNVYLYPSNTETELKNAYIGEYGWKPNANTYIYYPLTSNLADQMGNGNTGTMTGTCTFDSSTGIHVTGRSGNYVTGLSNGINARSVFTLNVRAKYENSNDGSYILGYTTPYGSTQCVNISLRGSVISLGFYYNGNSGTYNEITADTNWHNYVITRDSNGNVKQYTDNVKLYDSSTNAPNNVSEMQLGWGGTYGSNRSANGYIKDYIVETVAWTAEEISDYYDATKGNYGL